MIIVPHVAAQVLCVLERCHNASGGIPDFHFDINDATPKPNQLSDLGETVRLRFFWPWGRGAITIQLR